MRVTNTLIIGKKTTERQADYMTRESRRISTIHGLKVPGIGKDPVKMRQSLLIFCFERVP